MAITMTKWVFAVAIVALAASSASGFAFDRVYSGPELQQLLSLSTGADRTWHYTRSDLTAWMKRLKSNLFNSIGRMGYRLAAPDPSTAFDWIPIDLGDAKIDNSVLTWFTPCFDQASLRVNYSSTTTFTLTLLQPTANCEEDVYVVATPNGLMFHKATSEGIAQFTWDGTLTEAERTWINANGFRIMRLAGNTQAMLESLLATVELFLPAELTKGVWQKAQEYNMAFLRSKADYYLPRRNITDVVPDADQINDGDFFGVLRPDGLDPMLAWAMGAHTGHTTIALRFEGELYICESTTDSAYWPTNGIQRTPYKQWIAQAKAASFQVVHLPLSAQARAKFNSTQATDWFLRNAQGLPYGFANMLFSWIDTDQANYPGTLNAQIHEILVGIVDAVAPGAADLLWNRGFNQRLGTSNLTTLELYNTAASRGISFADMFKMPEQDKWKYLSHFDNKNEVVPSMVCDVLVCETWKAGGLLGDLAEQIQCTEFTNWDAYTLDIFDTTTPRPDACVQADPDLPFCQILGEWRMSLPSFNTRTPVAKMAQACPRGSPPNWDKPVGC